MQIYGVELELWIAVLVAVLGLTVWGLKKYQKIMADGKVSLDEIIDTLTESESKIDDVVEAVDEVTSAMDAKKKAELIEMCKEKGLSTSGTKAELVARLSEAVEANTEEE
jgi:molybdenum cofactor biosynthesis enzyme